MLRKFYIKVMFWALRKLAKDKTLQICETDITHLKCKLRDHL